MKNNKSPQKMTNSEKMAYIHLLYINGQKQEMVKEIDEWGKTFFEDYRFYLEGIYTLPSSKREYFENVVIIYHKLRK